uniref:Uncharacterized protein n=1 Tax=Peronospora matthiolae TaxID=2874970 RepID=A0AAV1TC14_9STRA
MLGGVESKWWASALGSKARARPVTIAELADSPENKSDPRPLHARVPDIVESMFASFASVGARTLTFAMTPRQQDQHR